MINESQPCEDARQQDHSDDDDDEDPHDSYYWEKLSILDRLGLKSTLEMNEEEVESEFIRLSVGFHCDQYTLKQRLQTEEHERLVAEENVQRELLHTRDVLQVLCDRLTDVDSKEIVLQMKNRMKMMEENMENVLIAAESLGAVHQVPHTKDLMIQTSRQRQLASDLTPETSHHRPHSIDHTPHARDISPQTSLQRPQVRDLTSQISYHKGLTQQN